MRSLFLKLADYELRGKLLNLLDHVEFFHEDVAVALVGGHFELLQQDERYKGVKTDSCHQYHKYNYSWHTVGNSVLSEAYGGQSNDNYLKAIVERRVFGSKKQTMREEHHHCNINKDNLHDVHIVEYDLPSELEGHFWFDAVEVDYSGSARRVVQGRPDVKSKWEEEPAKEGQMQEQRIVSPPWIGTDQEQYYFECSSQEHILLSHNPALVVLVVKTSRDDHADEQQHCNGSVKQSQTADNRLLCYIVDLINRQANGKERSVGDYLLQEEKFNSGDAHKQWIHLGCFAHFYSLISLMIIFGLYLLQLEEVFIDGQFSLELDGHDEGIVLKLVLDRTGHCVAYSRGLLNMMGQCWLHEVKAFPIISILINLNIINKSQGWPFSSSLTAASAAETTSFPRRWPRLLPNFISLPSLLRFAEGFIMQG